MLAMLAIGLWSWQQQGSARLAMPAGFVWVRASGTVIGVAGLALLATAIG